jgi:predicted TIM-barrel fold metal-dependent hydrolase
VYVKLSHKWWVSKQPYPWLDAQEHVKRLYAVYGPRRLVWGTDWPVHEKQTIYAKILSVVRDDMKFLNEDDKSWILSKTVQKLWAFA